jgi:hypothetical protein
MRTKLGDRRHSVTTCVLWTTNTGAEIKLQVTFGFYEDGELREAFCASFKAGSDLHDMATDSCVLLSRLLQHGDSAAELAAALGRPPSLIGSIALAATTVEP